MLRNIRRVALAVSLSVMTCTVVSAQSSLIEQEEADLGDQEFENELRSPMVGPKLRSYVRTYMKSIAESLYHDGFDVETMREGEVVIAVIPTDGLFAPNEVKLMATAHPTLNRFRQFATPDDRFKIVVAVHSDDTGSEEYLYDLTEQRTVAILEYLESIGFNPDNIIGFPKGNSSPIAESISRANRAKNRRLEIFLVPSEELLIQARASVKK